MVVQERIGTFTQDTIGVAKWLVRVSGGVASGGGVVMVVVLLHVV